ncbi:hypothetical protein CJF30_00004748 [Rutstroemia sp. NJR-2017a BBW]|nr:hypothetical protein CJF30_00004748 [Rutstroemia sp. NJR-2017a BBW]
MASSFRKSTIIQSPVVCLGISKSDSTNTPERIPISCDGESGISSPKATDTNSDLTL